MIKPWTIVSENVRPAGTFRKVREVLYRLPDGREELYTLKEEGRTVCVLALTDDEHVILARQFRPGPNRVVDELPGGGGEDGESNSEAALRELLEETGYKPRSIESLGFPLECAYSNVKREGFLARGCVRIQDQILDQNEFIEVVKKPILEFIEQVIKGDCTDPEIGWAGLYKAGYIAINVSSLSATEV